MFLIMKNSGESGSGLSKRLIAELETVSPASRINWVVPHADLSFDGQLEWDLPGARLLLNVEIKARSLVSRDDVRRIVGPSAEGNPLVAASFISPAARDELRRWGWSYWDETGNVLIQNRDPFVWVERSGLSRNPNPGETGTNRKLLSLKGQAASVVIVKLLTEGRAPSVRELSRQTEVGVATVSRVLELLRDEDLLKETNGGPVVINDATTLATRWAQDYSFMKTFRSRRYFSLLGEEVAREKLRTATFEYALTGVEAANDFLGSEGRFGALPVSDTWIYTSDRDAAERALQLVADPRGNFLIGECGFLGQEQGRRSGKDFVFAQPWRTVGDLLSTRGRTASVGMDLAESLERARVR